ncbi:MAG: YciC family protein [Motiliproteus sp.]
MFTPLKEAGYFARQHAQPLLIIALLLTLPIWLVDAMLEAPAADAKPDLSDLLLMLFYASLGVVQFAAGMFYIHGQVQKQPISTGRAISLGLSRLGPLLLINLLMALAVSTGLMLLVLPGLYLAYKLLFCEFLLLFHGHSVWQSLRGSFRLNRELSNKLLPSLVLWVAIVAMVSVLQQVLLEGDGPTLLVRLVFEPLLLIISVLGWALLYRLYQCFIAPQLPAPVYPLAVQDNNDQGLVESSQSHDPDDHPDKHPTPPSAAPSDDNLTIDSDVDPESDPNTDQSRGSNNNPDQPTDRKEP